MLVLNNLKHFNATYLQEVELQDKSYKYHNDYLPLYAWIHQGVLTRIYSIVILLSHNWLFIIIDYYWLLLTNWLIIDYYYYKAGSRERNCWRRLFKWFLKVWGHSWQASSAWAYTNVFVQTEKKNSPHSQLRQLLRQAQALSSPSSSSAQDEQASLASQ